MKTVAIIFSILLGFFRGDVKPDNVDYIKIQRIEAITNKVTPQIFVSCAPLKIELSDYEKEDFKTSLLKDTNTYIKLRYTLVTTNKVTYKMLEKCIYNNKACYSKGNEQYGYLITEQKNLIKKYFFVPQRNAPVFFDNTYSYLKAKKCDSVFCERIRFR